MGKNRKLKSWFEASMDQKILSALVTVTGLTSLSRIVEALIHIVVAYLFGRSDQLDCYLIAYLIPSFAIQVVSGAFHSSIMPTYVWIRENEGATAAGNLFKGVLFWSICLIVLLSFIFLILGKVAVPLLGSGFTSEKIELTLNLYYFLLPVFLVNCLSRIWGTVINAEEKFAVVAITPAVRSIVVIFFLFLFTKDYGIYSFAAGLMAGSCIEMAMLAVAMHSQGFPVLPSWRGLEASVKQIFRQFFPMLIGACLMGGTELVDQSMAAMTGSGNVSALSYAGKIVMFILVVASGAIGAAVFPYFSKMTATGDIQGIKQVLLKFTALICLLSIPVMIIMMVFSREIVALLFERGNFNIHDTLVVHHIFFYYLFQIPFYIVSTMGVRLMSAIRKNQVLMVISGINLMINIIGNFILIHYMGVAGISLSTTIVCVLSMVMIYGAVGYEFKKWGKDAV